MQKILKKRIWRDLKANGPRYLALWLLIVMGMYLSVSMVGAADTIIIGGERNAEKLCREDGEFQVFVPLTEKEEEQLRELGIVLEKQFYMDYEVEEKRTLRVLQEREKLNRFAVDDGSDKLKDGEALLEKRYAEEHAIQVGDPLEVGGNTFTVKGIGSVPDYDAPMKNLSDACVDSEQFGLIFVSEEDYAKMKKEGNSTKSEEYVYAYQLGEDVTNKEVKDVLKEFTVKAEDIEDPYFQEYWEENGGEMVDLEDGIHDLNKGAKKLENGLEELRRNNDELNEGTEQVFAAFLQQANAGLMESGMLKEKMTEDNFEETMERLKAESDTALARMSLDSTLDQLKDLKRYKDGVKEYIGGVKKAAKGSGKLKDGTSELEEETEEFFAENEVGEMKNLTLFLPAEDNTRIGASAEDQVINKMGGLIAGVIVMILITYVISVFVIHGIDKESTVIGALYSLGVTRKDLLMHYVMLPVVITFLGGVVGTVIGFSKWGVASQCVDCYGYFSIPQMPTVCSGYLLVYGIVMPPVAAILVNTLVIWKRLSQPALRLLRNEQKKKTMRRNVPLGNMGFVGRFRVRQMLREMRTGFTVVFGMFVSLLIFMLGLNCYTLCQHISVENKADTKYEYMYTYKYPDKEVPEGGEACFAKSLKKEILGYNLDVTLLGVEGDNPYFDVEPREGRDKVIISSAMAQKYGLKEGDTVVLRDEELEQNYAFTVDGITQYSTAFYVFMDIDEMREMFGEAEDYYNVVFADEALDIETGRLYATTSKEEISKSSDVFVEQMVPLITMTTVASTLIFCVVMYLMLKVMIDRSAFGIALVKIFGYRAKEIRKLYLDGNFCTIAVGAAVCIPLAKKGMDMLYPMLVSNVACGMNLAFSWKMYASVYAGVILLYFIITPLLVRHVKQMLPANVLKNRE